MAKNKPIKIGRSIRIIREAKAIRLAKTAKLARISIPFLSLIERDKRQPSLDILRRISEVLGVPCEAFILSAMPEDEI